MGLFGSLITGVSGLKGQSVKMGAVSDNIANVSTVGYKRVDVQFSTLVTERISTNSFQPGGVMARPRQMVDQQGILSQSTTDFDMAVSGAGLFTVTNDPENPNANQFYTRAGSFRPDEELRLKNSSGFFLQAFPTDTKGNMTGTMSTGSLEIVSLEDHQQFVQGTSEVTMDLNLPAESTPSVAYPNVRVQAATGTGRFVEADLQDPADFTQTFDVYDDHGVRHSVTYRYSRINDPATPNLWMVQIDEGDITGMKDANAGVAGTQAPDANFHVRSDDGAGNITDNVTNTLYLQFDGTGALVNARVPSAASTPGSFANSEAVINQATSPTEPPVLMRTLIGNVELNGIVKGGGTIAAPPGTAAIGQNHITVNNGVVSSIATESPFGTNGAQGLSFTVDIGRPTQLNGVGSPHNGTGKDGIQSVASNKPTPDIKVNYFTQDGSPPSQLVGIQVDGTGLMSAVYGNGSTKAIYQLALARFNNPNGLINESGNVYRESIHSGDVNLRQPNEDGIGTIRSKALENSNVDLGDEFTNMIITQQAFTANTRTVSTADQMLQELVNIIR